MTNNTFVPKIVIVDDHLLFAGSLEKLITSFSGFEVLYQAKNGLDLQQLMRVKNILPDVILLDIHMPEMDGFKTMQWLSKSYPKIKVLALSVEDNEQTILKMLRYGANGYLLKNIHPEKLKVALNEVIKRGYYHSDRVASTLIHSLHPVKEEKENYLKEKEITLLKLACTEMTYKEIAAKMNLSPKTIDGYRNDLFRKLEIKNRVGLVIYALKNNFCKI